MSQVTEQSVRFQTALASIKLIQASAVLDLTEDDFDFLTSNKVWIATDRSRARRCVEACVYGTLDFVGYPRFPAPVEFIAAVIAYYVHPVNIQTACLIMEGAEFTENIINGVERPVKAAELFAFTLRVRAGNTDVLTDAEENVRQKLRAEGVMSCLKVKNVLALALVVRSRCEVLKASVKALVFGMSVVNNFNCRGFGPLLEDKLCLIFKLAPSVCRMTFPILAFLLVRLVVLLPFQILRLSLASSFFFLNETATTDIYTLSLHDALPISHHLLPWPRSQMLTGGGDIAAQSLDGLGDRKSTRLNSSYTVISYAVFCLK